LAICVRQSVVHSEIDISPSDSHLEISGIKTTAVSIFNIYNPPRNNFAMATFDFLSDLKNVVLCGDFNSHHGMWGSQLSNTNGRNLVGLVEKHDYVLSETQLFRPICYHGSWNLLHLTLVSNSLASHCSSTVTNDLLGNDHTVILTEIRGCSPRNSVRPTWNFTKANWPLFNEICESALTSFSVNLRYSYQLFETSILDAASHSIPTTKPWRKQSVPWWTKVSDVAVKNKKHAYLRMKRTRSTADIIIFKRSRAKTRRIILEAKQSSWQKFCSSISCNLRLSMAWKKIKCFSGNHAFLHIPILKHNGITSTNDQHKANILANHIATISAANYTQQFYCKPTSNPAHFTWGCQ